MNPQLRSLLQVLGLNSIATRLTLSFAFLLMLFVGIGLTTVEQVRQIAQSNSRFQQTDMQRLRDVQELRSEFEGIGIQLLDVFTKNYESKNDLYVLIDARAAKIKQQINACIRAGDEIVAEDFDCDINLLRLWALVKSIKDDCLFLCRNDGPAAYIGYNRIDAEGYVLSNEFGMFKLVNREVFAYANFNFGRFQAA